MKRFLLLVLTLAIACRAERRSRADSLINAAAASDSAAPITAAPNWLTYDAGAFTIRYPPDATLKQAQSHPSDQPGTAIVGPRIHVPVASDVGPSDGPAYQLVVSSLPNANALSTKQWVDSVRLSANNHEMDVDSLAFLHPADTVTVNGLQFLRLQPFCGDCSPEELYLADGNRMALLSYVFDISFPGDREQQRNMYLAMLKTFRWKARR